LDIDVALPEEQTFSIIRRDPNVLLCPLISISRIGRLVISSIRWICWKAFAAEPPNATANIGFALVDLVFYYQRMQLWFLLGVRDTCFDETFQDELIDALLCLQEAVTVYSATELELKSLNQLQ
jgi:hypothetical protein